MPPISSVPPRHSTIRLATIAMVVAAMTWSSLPYTADAAPALIDRPRHLSGDVGEGSTGPYVEEVQDALVDGGVYLPGGVDGFFGPATTRGVRQFQHWNGLDASGIVDSATARTLGIASGASGTQTVSTYAGLSLGSRGDAVVELQHALLDTGLVIRGDADGYFGPATRRALMAFQRVNAMSETGAMSDRAADLLDLGSSNAQASSETESASETEASNRESDWPGSVNLERFPVQGNCWFGDTWHAPRAGGRLHEGVDIIAASGNLLYAVADGTITTQWWDQPGRSAGNGVRLTAADGTYFVYLHMSGFAPGLSEGTKVQAGDVIGFVGTTGSSATPHLHFEIHPGGGNPVNPYPYVKAIDDCSDTTPHYQGSFT